MASENRSLGSNMPRSILWLEIFIISEARSREAVLKWKNSILAHVPSFVHSKPILFSEGATPIRGANSNSAKFKLIVEWIQVLEQPQMVGLWDRHLVRISATTLGGQGV
jgi:hypothetical protein